MCARSVSPSTIARNRRGTHVERGHLDGARARSPSRGQGLVGVEVQCPLDVELDVTVAGDEPRRGAPRVRCRREAYSDAAGDQPAGPLLTVEIDGEAVCGETIRPVDLDARPGELESPLVTRDASVLRRLPADREALRFADFEALPAKLTQIGSHVREVRVEGDDGALGQTWRIGPRDERVDLVANPRASSAR